MVRTSNIFNTLVISLSRSQSEYGNEKALPLLLLKAEPSGIHSHTEYRNEKREITNLSRSQSLTGNAITEALPLLLLKAEPSSIHSHTEYGNEKALPLLLLKAEPSGIHSHTEYGNEKREITNYQLPITYHQLPILCLLK